MVEADRDTLNRFEFFLPVEGAIPLGTKRLLNILLRIAILANWG
jgi:hypothetical protein